MEIGAVPRSAVKSWVRQSLRGPWVKASACCTMSDSLATISGWSAKSTLVTFAEWSYEIRVGDRLCIRASQVRLG